MNFLSLFSGIGGLDLGLERAGLRCVAQVEIDPFCRKVLAKHWPDVPRFEDVRTVTREQLPDCIDLIAGGFPCQDISNAAEGGKGRKGLDGDRSGLWHEFRRLICEIRPQWVLVENVPAITIRGLDRVLGDLAKLGFDAEWDRIPAAICGAPHLRKRFFLVAYPSEVGRLHGARHHRTDDFPRDLQWRDTEDFKSGAQWKRWSIAASQAVDGEVSARDFFGLDDGISEDVDAIGGFGNAVVPQVAEWIGRRIMEAEGRAVA
jgi:DNA (cytosine-5)-methyltransferase 1